MDFNKGHQTCLLYDDYRSIIVKIILNNNNIFIFN